MTENEFFDRYAGQLSEQQKEAVLRTDGQTLLLAVPGSGKTTVLIARLGYMLLCKNIDPSKILTITYTVAATKDMAKRFISVFGEEAAAGLEFRTINGLCAKVILEYGRMIGKESYALQTNEGELQRIIRDILIKHMDEYPGESDIKTARTLITYSKNMMLDADGIRRLGEKEKFTILNDVYNEYNAYLKENRMMDYDDQMVYAYAILSRCPELLERYRKRFTYISVDEAQDTSKIQHEIIRLLAGNDGNLFMVGDEDQSIYGFRAAYPKALLNFTSQHPNGKVLIMDRNFRSGRKIVAMSDIVIQNNRMRHEKHMKATKDMTGAVDSVPIESRSRQYRYFVDKTDFRDHETAILCRDNESLVPFVDILDRRKIPFTIKGADVSFFTGRVVTDVTNMMEFSKNPDDPELFMKIYYKCKTFLKKYEAEQICSIAEKMEIPLAKAVKEAKLSPVAKSCTDTFFSLMKGLVSDQPVKGLTRIGTSLGYNAYLQKLGISGDRLYTLKAIANGESTINGFLNRLRYLRELMSRGAEGHVRLILSTIHSSKGLEYDSVYLADICDGVFPSHKPGDDPETDEEERRLFYVGMTRAREKLRIFTYGDAPSTFVNEIRQGVKMAKRAASREMEAASVNIKPEPGMKVAQPKFGEGVVVSVEPRTSADGHMTVRFADCEKTFAYPLAFAKGLRVI